MARMNKRYLVDVANINPAEYITVWECNCAYGLQVVMAVDDLMYLPEYKPPKGHWVGIDDEPFDMWECDNCGYVIEREEPTNFCPNCGADMKGEGE